jgi:hypothetical protein
MRPNLKLMALMGLVAVTSVVLIAPFASSAVESNPAIAQHGPWSVATIARDSADWQVEAYKVDKNLVAWTERTTDGNKRRLYAYDGVSTRLLAGLDAADWQVPESDLGFYGLADGSFDVADGLVVWLQSDGHDREVFGWKGGDVYRISDNAYDDRHPATSRGQVVWTSYPPNQPYNLMHKDAAGWRVLASWHVLNYEFSGGKLYWLNKSGYEDWFRVFVSDQGKPPAAIGKGDDRPLTDYFLTDGAGSAAWEYSTKRWDWDKREVFHSIDGQTAYRDLQRDVPPNEIRLEDVEGNRLIMNDKDWFYQNLVKRTTAFELVNGNFEAIWQKPTLAKVRYMDGGFVHHRDIEGHNTLVYRTFAGDEHFVGDQAVLLDRFEADGAAAAGARVSGGGIIAFADMETTVIPGAATAMSLKVHDGEIAWVEGGLGQQTLRYATRTLWVGGPTELPQRTAGYLAKAEGSPTVYLLTPAGKRYVFRSEQQFYGWYENFDSLRVLPASVLANYQLAGGVLASPGSRLIRSADSPRVYVMGQDGKLHWVTSAEVLKEVKGQNWTASVDVVSPAVFADYEVTGVINVVWEYRAAVNGMRY